MKNTAASGHSGMKSVVRAAKFIKEACSLRPTLALVLGSGFGHVINRMEIKKRLPYSSVPGFPPTSVTGHSGELLFGRLGGTLVMVLSGRIHFYEGYSMNEVTFGIRALAGFGVRDVLLTNAAGGVNPRFKRGDFMVITDHVNLMGQNPLRGVLWPERPRFVDLTRAYDPRLCAAMTSAGKAAKVRLRSGVYLAVSGPSYETPAEIRAFAALGADAVGMSTVPEAIVARQCGMRVAALSCITNLAAGISQAPLSHEEVLETAEATKTVAAGLLEEFAARYEPKD